MPRSKEVRAKQEARRHPAIMQAEHAGRQWQGPTVERERLGDHQKRLSVPRHGQLLARLLHIVTRQPERQHAGEGKSKMSGAAKEAG
jgi:hypothetical protein